jgi:hypothetical protein
MCDNVKIFFVILDLQRLPALGNQHSGGFLFP